MATTPKKPSREKEKAREGDMSLSPHPLCVHALPSRKQNRENRIKSAYFSKGHRNIAASNDKRPLFMQIPATPSASLVSTSLPIQCLRPTNFFFCRGIFSDNFLPNLSEPPHQRIPIGSERITTTSLTYSNHLGTYYGGANSPPERLDSHATFAPSIKQDS